MKKIILGLVMIVLLATNVLAADVPTDVNIQNPIKIEVDKGAFDENSLFGIYDEAGNLISQYSRFSNPNTSIQSCKIYDKDKNHIYTISADDKERLIYIMDKDGKRAKIKANITQAFFSVKITTDVSYYGQPYVLLVTAKMKFPAVTYTYVVENNNEPVIKGMVTYGMSGSTTEITVNQDFLTANPTESMVWTLALVIFDEMIYEISNQAKNNNNRNNNNFNQRSNTNGNNNINH